MNKTHILIISDIHLGSKICNSVILLETLKGYFYEKLIIVGDLYERGGVFTDEHFEFLRYLRENRGKIIYIDGNHDPAGEGLINGIIGIDAVKKYKWEICGKKLCAIHGHQFDKLCFIFSEPLIDKIFMNFVWCLKMINMHWFNIAKWLDDFHNNLSFRFANKAKKYAKKHKINIIICGHIHKPLHLTFTDKNGSIEYFNCGSWVEDTCSFITIDENGKIKLHSILVN